MRRCCLEKVVGGGMKWASCTGAHLQYTTCSVDIQLIAVIGLACA